jgi:tetratricopeptide (TPR) repeat protein
MRHFRRLLPVLLSAIAPGAGHLVRRQYLRAAALLLTFVVLLDGVAIGLLLVAPREPELGHRLALHCGIGAGFVWLVALGHMIYRSYVFDENRQRQRVELLFRQGQQDYLRGDHQAALEAFKQAIKLDREDADLRLYLASTYQALGQRRRARRALRKCLNVDDAGKWTWEVEQALAATKKKR